MSQQEPPPSLRPLRGARAPDRSPTRGSDLPALLRHRTRASGSLRRLRQVLRAVHARRRRPAAVRELRPPAARLRELRTTPARQARHGGRPTVPGLPPARPATLRRVRATRTRRAQGTGRQARPVQTLRPRADTHLPTLREGPTGARALADRPGLPRMLPASDSHAPPLREVSPDRCTGRPHCGRRGVRALHRGTRVRLQVPPVRGLGRVLLLTHLSVLLQTRDGDVPARGRRRHRPPVAEPPAHDDHEQPAPRLHHALAAAQHVDRSTPRDRTASPACHPRRPRRQASDARARPPTSSARALWSSPAAPGTTRPSRSVARAPARRPPARTRSGDRPVRQMERAAARAAASSPPSLQLLRRPWRPPAHQRGDSAAALARPARAIPR